MNKTRSTETIYAFTIPVFVRTLKNVSKVLATAERHAKRHGIEPTTLLSARLYPDMFPLLQQVQYLCFIPVDFAKNFTGAAAPRVGYDETSFADLKASIKKTIGYLRAIKPERLQARHGTLLPIFFDSSKGLRPEAHATRLTLPNFFFHAVVAYAILRHSGVPIGKADYLGSLDASPIKKAKK